MACSLESCVTELLLLTGACSAAPATAAAASPTGAFPAERLAGLRIDDPDAGDELLFLGRSSPGEQEYGDDHDHDDQRDCYCRTH